MTTPTPAGSSVAGMGITTPSPLAMLSNTTPRGSAIGLSSLQSLPETQLVLVLLDHPTIRRKWRTVVVPLVESISKKLNTTYSGSRLTIGCVVYRSTLDKSLLRPEWTLSRTKLQPGSKLIASNIQTPEPWLGPEQTSSGYTESSSSAYALIDGKTTAKATAHVLEAFVAALELLRPSGNGIHNPLAPKKPPVLARHLLHVCLDSTDITLDLASPPFFNLDAANDRLTAPAVGNKLARLGASITSCAVKPEPNNGAPSTSREALAAIVGLHKIVADPNKLTNEDLATLLPEAVRAKIFQEANIVSSGLTPGNNPKAVAAAASPAGNSTKRAREDDAEAASTPTKRSKSGSISQPQPPTSASNASVATTAAPGGSAGEVPRNIKLDPNVSTKILFLRSQQETMIRNWAAAYSAAVKSEMASEPAKAPGTNKAYLEQLKAQLMTQQQALKMLVQRIVSGAETAPNFNVSLQSLINIDKEAREMGINLGGPSSGARQARSGSLTGAQQPPLPLQSVPRPPATSVDTAVASDSTAAAASGPPPSPTRPKPFWRGALTWSVISDPTTKQKRDVATLVSATSNTPALDKLLLPWPDKLQITAITQLSPRNLQAYAQSQNAPYILFSTQDSSSSSDGGPVLTSATAEKNKQMYTSLASSLDAKKSCAFIRHGGNAGAGVVVFATNQATNGGKGIGGLGGVKLIGVVLKDSIPFTRLLSAQNATGPQAVAGKVEEGQAGRSRGTSGSGTALQETSQPTAPVVPQQQGMGLGSSMPFNLNALNAAGNVPVSTLGSGMGAAIGSAVPGLANSSQPAQSAAAGNMNLGDLGNLANFNMNFSGGQQQDAFGGNGAPMGQPNLAALAQLLGIGGQSGQPQQQQHLQGFGQAMPAFGQMTMPQQQQQLPQQGQQVQQMFGAGNAFNATAQPQQPPPQQGAAGGSGGQAAGSVDFSKPMTMDQLRALGFLS